MAESLTLFASALAGRPIPLERTDRALGGSDGFALFLPQSLDASAREARWLVICLAVLQRSGTHERRILRKLSRSGTVVVQRYLTLEVWRSCLRVEHLLPTAFLTQLRGVMGGIEVPGDATESFRRARSTERLPQAPAWFGELVPTTVLSSGHATAGSPGLADAEIEANSEAVSDKSDDVEGPGERSRIMELLSWPLRNPFGDAFQKMLGMSRSLSDGDAGAEMPVAGARRSAGTSSKGRLVPGAVDSWVDMAGQIVVGASYPEWDFQRGQYREGWTLVGEFDPAPDREQTDEVATDAGASAVEGNRRLMRALARLGLSWQTHRGEPMGDGIDLTALVDLRARIVAGEGGDADIYTAHRRTSQRLGVLILLDATGSTSESVEGSAIFERQRELTFALTTALDQLGARTATYAFYSRGRRNVRFLRVKGFADPWSVAARRRLMSIRPSGFTRLGAAVRHASQVIATRAGTDHQLVVVIGDGVLYDDGYEGSYATEDARFAIEEAAAQGVALVGLSVAPLPDESIWPHAQHRVTRDADELAPHVAHLFGGALQRARRPARPAPHSRSSHVRTAF